MNPPMEQVTANVYANTRIRGCNPSYVVTTDGVVVIDTPQLPTKAVAMREEAETHGPIRYVINTEHHVDHIFGNYYFKPVPVVHHKGVADNFMVVAPILYPFSYAKEAIPTDDPEGEAIFPDRDEYYADPNDGSIVFTGDLRLRVGDTAGARAAVPTPGEHDRRGQVRALLADALVDRATGDYDAANVKLRLALGRAREGGMLRELAKYRPGRVDYVELVQGLRRPLVAPH